MDITQATVPGAGLIHQCSPRSGQRFGIVVDNTGRRSLLVYDPADPDEPAQTITLDQDEADQVAEILHSRPLLDRIARIEQHLNAPASIQPGRGRRETDSIARGSRRRRRAQAS